ncbi:hypothetical protein [Micromonospora vulcania]|uniref:DUF7919 domain-containing protein n=1 Tax=Micromonospora vulcania TaxID=1441873 RepID=A0ABW1H418_9ACTN
MTYFEDLSTYDYRDLDTFERSWGWLQFRPEYRRIAVGWLDAPYAFEKGPVPAGFAARLLDIVAGPPVNSMRGWHDCSHCPPSSDADAAMLSVELPSGAVALGHTEIRVPARPGVVFAAPSLIWHYVTVHAYLPPAEFIAAVQAYEPRWADEPSPWVPPDAERTTFD